MQAIQASIQASPASMVPPLSTVDVESLGASPGRNPEDVAQALESVFASLLIKEMRKTLSDGIFGSEQSDVLGGMFDLHMGQAMTDGPGLGIKQLVLAQLAAQSKTVPQKGTEA